jgi:hypothetical protein
MATLTGVSNVPVRTAYETLLTSYLNVQNTAGSLKKMFPPVKKKAIETLPSFATFLTGGAGTSTTAANGEKKEAAPKAAGKKRKATSEPETDAAAAQDLQPNGDKSDENTDGKKKKAPAKPRARGKKVKKEPAPEEAAGGEDNGMSIVHFVLK